MNNIIASLMLFSAIQADAVLMTQGRHTVNVMGAQVPPPGAAPPGLEERLDEVEQKKLAVAAKLRGIDRIVKSDENHHSILKTKGLLTDERNAKNYLHDADTVVKGKIALKEGKRVRFTELVEQQKRLQAGNEAKEVKVHEDVKAEEAKYGQHEQERDSLVEMKKKETKLNEGVTRSQLNRLSDINEKLGLDKRGIDGLNTKLQFEKSQENKLTSELATIVRDDEEVTKIRADLLSNSTELDRVRMQLEAARVNATDCANQTKVNATD